MDKLRIGLVGAQFAARLHLNSLAKLTSVQAQVVAVAARSLASAQRLAGQYGIPEAYDDYRRLLERRDVDVVDLCLPTDLHEELCIAAAQAGKHVICEKPLTGYFGKQRPEELVGQAVAKELMRREALAGCGRVQKALADHHVKLMYAENWVYAPAVAKLKALVQASGGTMLDIRAEQSHSGSAAAYSRRWKTSGGGALLRLGSHPVGAVLHLKAFEGLAKGGRPIRPRYVTAETGQHSKIASYVKEKKKYLVSDWEDVEDWGALVIGFADGSSATVIASDGVLGGVRNTMAVYLSNAVVQVNMNPNDGMLVYAPEAQVFGDEYLVEKLETKAGWNFPSPDEDWARGYPQELEDFLLALKDGREPLSGFDLAHDVVQVIYAAYQSAEEGRRVELSPRS